MKNIKTVLHRIYSILMTVSFFGGIVPLVPFIIAMIIGGSTGEAIAVTLYKQVYPWVIGFGSVAVVVGMLHTYIDKLIARSEKKAAANN